MLLGYLLLLLSILIAIIIIFVTLLYLVSTQVVEYINITNSGSGNNGYVLITVFGVFC